MADITRAISTLSRRFEDAAKILTSATAYGMRLPVCDLALPEFRGFQDDPAQWLKIADSLGDRHGWSDGAKRSYAEGRLREAAEAWNRYNGHTYRSWHAERSAMNSVSSAPSTNEMARQPVYETTLGPRVKQREPDEGPDRPSQSPAITLLGPQQQPRAGPLRPKPPLHQGSSRSAPVSSSTQQQPVPTPHGSSSSGGGNPSAPTPATRDHDPVLRQASAAIDQSHPPPWSPTSANASAGAVAVKRSIHAGVKALFPGSARRPRHSGHRNEAPPQNGSDHALQPLRAPPPADSLPSHPSDSPRKPEEKRGRPAAPPTKINGAPSKGISPTPPETYNAERQDNRRIEIREDIEGATKEVSTDLPVQKMDSRLAHLLEAKQSLLARWKGQRLNRRLRKKIAEVNRSIEEHCKGA
ncbi:uncharacterized protein LOC119432847 [Dermacentor silvarum]|uniref:uncharacterized protein LOC119432847 n=1 Tax=Dermacentor silvarum TaxID=543639 RepID=UPI001896F4B1|nr:uncharacterized protein LOC119432847 [Dermacentor silvarum]